MFEKRRQQNFEERLRRIEQQHAAEQPEATQPAKPAPDYGYRFAQKEDHRLRNGIIWVAILAAVGAGGYFGAKALPEDMTNAIAGLVSSPEDPATNTGSMVVFGSGGAAPTETETMSDLGPVLASPIVVHQGDRPLALSDVVATPDLTNGDTDIGQIIPFARNAQCDLRDPLPSEKVVNVRVENALLPAPIQAFSNAQLASQLLENIEAVTQDGKAYDADQHFSGQKTSLDVFVTDTTAPVYLVLQNIGPGVIWNVQAAANVTIAHVAIIASNYSGLVAPPSNTTFEALLVRDFVPPHELGLDDEIRDCMIRPWRNPQPGWIGSMKAEAGDMSDEIQAYTKGYAAFNGWYTQTLGVDAGTNLVTARDAAHVLIGPVPAEPMLYRPLAGQDIHLMETDNMFAGDAATRQAITADLHNNLLLAAIGGDISLLDAAPMERPTQ